MSGGRTRKRRHCIHGYNTTKQKLRWGFTQHTVDLHASGNVDVAQKTYAKNAKGVYCLKVSVVRVVAADQTRMMQDQMSGAAMAMPNDPSKAFKVRFQTARLKAEAEWPHLR